MASDRSKRANTDKKKIALEKGDGMACIENQTVKPVKEHNNALSNTASHDCKDPLNISSIIDNLLSDRLESTIKVLEDSVDITLWRPKERDVSPSPSVKDDTVIQ